MIFDCLQKNMHISLTAKEIEDSLRHENVEVGKSTIYRHLDKLIEDGEVRKFVDEKSKSATFQYVGKEHNCHDHLHLKCYCCGELYHLKCAHMGEVIEHLWQHHNFKIDNSKTVLLGICTDCNTNYNEE